MRKAPNAVRKPSKGLAGHWILTSHDTVRVGGSLDFNVAGQSKGWLVIGF